MEDLDRISSTEKVNLVSAVHIKSLHIVLRIFASLFYFFVDLLLDDFMGISLEIKVSYEIVANEWLVPHLRPHIKD